MPGTPTTPGRRRSVNAIIAIVSDVSSVENAPSGALSALADGISGSFRGRPNPAAPSSANKTSRQLSPRGGTADRLGSSPVPGGRLAAAAERAASSAGKLVATNKLAGVAGRLGLAIKMQNAGAPNTPAQLLLRAELLASTAAEADKWGRSAKKAGAADDWEESVRRRCSLCVLIDESLRDKRSLFR